MNGQEDEVIEQYRDFVRRKVNPGFDLRQFGLKLAGEAGECADLIGKFFYHGIPEN